MKSGSLNLLEPSGPRRSCYGTALPCCCVIITNNPEWRQEQHGCLHLLCCMDLFVPVMWTLFSSSAFCCQKTGPNNYVGLIWLLEYYYENHKYGVSYSATLNKSRIHPTDIVRAGVPFERTRRTTTGSQRFGTNCLIITELLGNDTDVRDYPTCWQTECQCDT